MGFGYEYEYGYKTHTQPNTHEKMVAFVINYNESTSIATLNDIYLKSLKQYVDLVFADQSVKQLLTRQFEYDESIPTLKRLLLISIFP